MPRRQVPSISMLHYFFAITSNLFVDVPTSQKIRISHCKNAFISKSTYCDSHFAISVSLDEFDDIRCAETAITAQCSSKQKCVSVTRIILIFQFPSDMIREVSQELTGTTCFPSHHFLISQGHVLSDPYFLRIVSARSTIVAISDRSLMIVSGGVIFSLCISR